MRDDHMIAGPAPYRIVILTLDSHAAGPIARVGPRLAQDFPGLRITVHAAAEWRETPHSLQAARADIAQADMILVTLLFLEDHIAPVAEDLRAARDRVDAIAGIISDAQIVRLTRLGRLDMAAPPSGMGKLMKRLRGSSAPGSDDGARKMRMLRRLPRILKLIPGKAQDLRSWFLVMQYWLGGSDENIESMVRHLLGRFATSRPEWLGAVGAAPIEHPEVGLYHPDLPGRITTDARDLPCPAQPVGTVGLLMMRSYVLSADTAHYDAVIRRLEAQGLRVLPAFAGGLDSRPAINGYFRAADGSARIDALVSLTGFSLVGGPAYNDTPAAVELLTALDVPYIAAHPLEFQTLAQWAACPQGLGPIETTMLIALPELDGATCPTVFAGRHGAGVCGGCAHACSGTSTDHKAMAPCHERIDSLAEKVLRQVRNRRHANADRRVAIVLFGFPPNAGATGTAAYLSVFRSLLNTLRGLRDSGHTLEVPDSVEALREAILGGSANRHGQEANVADYVDADTMVRETPPLAEIEAAWGPAPGKVMSDGRGVFILGRQFGNVFVGVQPAFGYEGDPMRLLFERGFAPTHAFAQFYLYLRNRFCADVVLHFGMHGALEFMPGKQAGLGARDWPDRLMGEMPNVYLYAANNPSEATLAKRRAGAVTVSHLTPPLAVAGLYKGMAELKESLSRWRAMAPDTPEREELEQLIAEQAAGVDMTGPPEGLWLTLLESENALIPEGLHVVGEALSPAAVDTHLAASDAAPEVKTRMAAALRQDSELPALLHAIGGGFTPPVPGGDLIRSPDILPTGRNIHAFDPFRMPTAFACREGTRQAQQLLDTHDSLPRSVALVLWGSDNIKTDGSPIGQALALMGARPRFDAFGRLSGAELIPLAELGRPRVDVVMTLSGIFRDLLPLQTRLLAEATLLAARAEEPEAQNFIRAHALAQVAATGCTLQEAALRVFSNAEGAYGSNVNQLVDSSAFGEEDELADAYEARKSFAYGVDGKAEARPALLQAALSRVEVAYQNLESVELGVTTVDHYFDTLGGISRAVKRARGTEAAVYISDQTRGNGRIRTLRDQVALETRARALNPRFYEPLLDHGAEGVRAIESHVTNTMGWSATTGSVDPWVYQRLSETFVLDDAMRNRLADLNPTASSRMAGRLLEASDRNYWQPDSDTLAALQAAADALEDRMEAATSPAPTPPLATAGTRHA